MSPTQKNPCYNNTQEEHTTHQSIHLPLPQKREAMKNSNSVIYLLCFCICTNLIRAGDVDNLQDMCPTDTKDQRIFINGFLCKNPANITASDFKSSLLNQGGDTDNFYNSAMKIITAAEFPGLNTLGLSLIRTDLEDDGLVAPHAHPRASEMMFVSSGVVVAGFVDSNNQVFQKVVNEGDVFVVPRGLLHFCFNAGFEHATIFSVLNSQNPGLVSISGAMFGPNAMKTLRDKSISLSTLDLDRIDLNLQWN